jgi:hypothetical protein
MQKRMSILAHLNKVPPPLLLALASSRGRTLSVRELSARSGVPIRTLTRISMMPDWSTVKLSTLSDIARACRVDLLRLGSVRRRIKRMAIQARVPFAALHSDNIAYASRERRRQRVLRAMMPNTDACP